MRSVLSLLTLCLTLRLAPLVFAQTPGTITTVAGSSTAGYTGDGGPAVSALLNGPVFVATDPAGNVYIADQNNNVIRKVTLAGTISTFAGTGIANFSGDNGPATQAELNNPIGVFVEPNGSVLIADVGNQRIRLVDTQGIITTVAGNGVISYSGDNGPAIDASFHNCVRAVADAAGNIYIADQSNHRVRKVDTAGIVTTIAGTGDTTFSGDNGPAVDAALYNPTALALDSAGNLYIADQFNQRIRKIDTAGIITTVAGNGNATYSGDGGPALDASLNYPGGVIVDTSGNIFFGDDLNYRVRRVSPDGIITTVAGNGIQGYSGDGGPATSASLNGTFGLAIDPSGDLLLADAVNNRIRSVYRLSSVAPVFTSAAITNSASFASGGSPGELATIFGQHLSVNYSGIANATTLPLNTSLAGTSVTVNGIPAPILAVVNINGGEQINLQIPWEAATQLNASVVIDNGVASSVTVPVQLTATQPGVFLIDTTDGAIEHVNGSIVSAANPAAPGETVVVFATGLGVVAPALTSGQAAPPSPLSYTSIQPTVTVANLPAVVAFSGAAPYLVGVDQLNVQLPANVPSGPQPLVISSNGETSNTATIQIQ